MSIRTSVCFPYKGSQGQLKGSEGQPAGLEGQPAGSEGQPEGGCTDVCTYGRTYRISPHSTGLRPLSGPVPKKQGHRTADLMMLFGDWFLHADVKNCILNGKFKKEQFSCFIRMNTFCSGLVLDWIWGSELQEMILIW